MWLSLLWHSIKQAICKIQLWRPYADDETREKIDIAREKGIPLASVNFRIKEKSFDGVHFKLSLREEIAKDLIERIREKVIEIDPSLETGVANTLVPYFDINFYNFYDLFLKEPEELSISKEVQPHESLAIDCSELNLCIVLRNQFKRQPLQ